MKAQMTLCLTAAAMLAGCSKSEPTTPAATPPAAPAPAQPAPPAAAPEPSGSVLTAPVDYLKNAADAKKSMEKKIDTVALKSAIDQFFAAELRYPKDLNELVTGKYIGSIPTPPYGTKLEYNANSGEVKVVTDPNPPPLK